MCRGPLLPRFNYVILLALLFFHCLCNVRLCVSYQKLGDMAVRSSLLIKRCFFKIIEWLTTCADDLRPHKRPVFPSRLRPSWLGKIFKVLILWESLLHLNQFSVNILYFFVLVAAVVFRSLFYGQVVFQAGDINGDSWT